MHLLGTSINLNDKFLSSHGLFDKKNQLIYFGLTKLV